MSEWLKVAVLCVPAVLLFAIQAVMWWLSPSRPRRRLYHRHPYCQVVWGIVLSPRRPHVVSSIGGYMGQRSSQTLECISCGARAKATGENVDRAIAENEDASILRSIAEEMDRDEDAWRD